MEELILNFPEQLREALKIGASAELAAKDTEIRNVVISGLGGSGIGGNFVREFVSDEIQLPVTVNKGYFIPNFVSEHTLFIVSSYSGNTEETLNALAMAEETGCEIACISSNGKVLEIAREKGYNHIVIPGGMPPRTCMGYSLVQQLYLLHHYGLISDVFQPKLESSIELMIQELEDIQQQAKELAAKIHDKIPVIYGEDRFESTLVRWRQQINENGKMLSWHHVIPEMNHNELVGWRKTYHDVAVLFIRSKDEYERNKQRMSLNKEIIMRYTPNIYDIHAKGNNHMEQSLYLVHLGDWVSYYLSIERGVDPTEVQVIDYLKGELAKID